MSTNVWTAAKVEEEGAACWELADNARKEFETAGAKLKEAQNDYRQWEQKSKKAERKAMKFTAADLQLRVRKAQKIHDSAAAKTAVEKSEKLETVLEIEKRANLVMGVVKQEPSEQQGSAEASSSTHKDSREQQGSAEASSSTHKDSREQQGSAEASSSTDKDSRPAALAKERKTNNQDRNAVLDKQSKSEVNARTNPPCFLTLMETMQRAQYFIDSGKKRFNLNLYKTWASDFDAKFPLLKTQWWETVVKFRNCECPKEMQLLLPPKGWTSIGENTWIGMRSALKKKAHYTANQ